MTITTGQWNKNGVRFTAYFTYVDIDTGEILDAKTTKNKRKYIRIKTHKHGTEYNINKTCATIRYTVEFRKQPQKEFDFS